MKCRCETLIQLQGAEAISYAKKHLQEMRIDPVAWQTEYVCPDTGKRWLLDYPHSEAHGGGSPRLRSLPLPTDSPD
jgi:hypothetical protein